jgi:hypothetical protein
MRLSELCEKRPLDGLDVYIVGLGPSMAFFPLEILENKFCVLLNDAQKYFPTLGPIAYANAKRFLDPLSPRIRHSIVKGRFKSDPNFERLDNHIPWDHPKFWVFSYVTEQDRIGIPSHREKETLWRDPNFVYICDGGTVAMTAIQFCCLAGAKTIFMVGCDCRPIYKEHYFSSNLDLERSTHTRNPKGGVLHHYSGYLEGILVMKMEAWRRFRIPVLNLTPFIGTSNFDEQFTRFKKWKEEEAEEK